jgi:hypothetical protein
METQLNGTVTALRVAIGLMATLAGLDKFFNLLTNWEAYVAPVAQQLLPISATTFMAVVGVIESVVGITILATRPSLGAFVAGAWLLLVAANLVLGGHFDIAVRDVVLAVAVRPMRSGVSNRCARARRPRHSSAGAARSPPHQRRST